MGGPTYADGFGRPYEADRREALRLGVLNLEEPFESNVDGCPGGWYRTPFFDSVARYIRPEGGPGQYSPNLMLERCDDDLIIEAVHYFEACRQRWHTWSNKVVSDYKALKGK